MKRYQPRPDGPRSDLPGMAPVLATQLTKDNVEEVAKWCGGGQVEEIDALNHNDTYVGINVPTLAGKERASEGDFIYQFDYPDGPGGFWVAPSSTFHAWFEEVEV